MAEYRKQNRGGIGLKNVQTSDRNGLVVGIACVTDQDDLLMVTEQGQIIRMPTSGMRAIGRNTQGVRLIDLADGDRVVSIATLMQLEDPAEVAETPEAPETPAGSEDPASEE